MRAHHKETDGRDRDRDRNRMSLMELLSYTSTRARAFTRKAIAKHDPSSTRQVLSNWIETAKTRAHFVSISAMPNHIALSTTRLRDLDRPAQVPAFCPRGLSLSLFLSSQQSSQIDQLDFSVHCSWRTPIMMFLHLNFFPS